MLNIIYQDESIVVCEKPFRVLSTDEPGGMPDLIREAIGQPEAKVRSVHRLDQVVGGIIPLVYFARPNSSLLRLTRCRFDGKALLHCCINGSSELMSNISMNLVGMLYNLQLLKYAGEDGIAAYGVMMYVSFIFENVFISCKFNNACLY